MAQDIFMFEESAKARRPIEGRKETLKPVTKKGKVTLGCRGKYNRYLKQATLKGQTVIPLADWAKINC